MGPKQEGVWLREKDGIEATKKDSLRSNTKQKTERHRRRCPRKKEMISGTLGTSLAGPFKANRGKKNSCLAVVNCGVRTCKKKHNPGDVRPDRNPGEKTKQT